MPLSRRAFVTLAAAACGFVMMPGMARALIASQTRVLHPARPLAMPSGEKAWEILEASAAGDPALRALQGRRITLTGYLKRLGPDEALLSRLPHHCDYCYLGKPGSVVRVKGISLPQTQARIKITGRFSCKGKTREIFV